MSITRLLLAAVLLAPALAHSEQIDITFIVAGKTANHRQQADGEIAELNYHFFAEIFLQPKGEASPSNLLTPLSGGEGVAFSDSGYALEMHGGRYKTEAQLEANYPDGDYVFRYTSPSIGSVAQTVTMASPNSQRSGIPTAPRIYLSQNGEPVAADSIDPDSDLLVRWSEFKEGRADPLGHHG